MNVAARTKPLDWKKILIVSAVLAIAGYQWYVQNVKTNPQQNNDVAQATSTDAAKYNARLPDEFDADKKSRSANQEPDQQVSSALEDGLDGRRTTGKATTSESIQSNRAAPKSFLVSTGGRNLRSPAGLIYGMGGGGEHRIEHVMRHGRDDQNRPAHGVFDGDQDSILKLLDEAYEMVKVKSKYVKTEKSQGNTAYTISMGRRVGYEGGEKGKRNGNRALNSVRLILDSDRVITAYPYR